MRVEPPDVVILEGPAVGAWRFPRARLRRSEPVLVSWYREHVDPSYRRAGDDDLILIRFHVEGVYEGLIGPLPWTDGVWIGDGMARARERVLYASPKFWLTLNERRGALVMAWGRWQSSSVPLPELVEIAVRDDPQITAERSFDPDLGPTPSPRWLELRLARERTMLLGPFSAADAEAAARGFAAYRAEHPFDARPLDVTEGELLADPARFHLRRVRVIGRWQNQFESSRFAGVWLEEPEGELFPRGVLRVRVVGTWIYPDAKAEGGFGHLGMWPGRLVAEAIEQVEG